MMTGIVCFLMRGKAASAYRVYPTRFCADISAVRCFRQIRRWKRRYSERTLTGVFPAALQMPAIDGDGLDRLLGEEFPSLEKKYRGQFVQLFLDLQKKCKSAEISSKALDLRGMLDALRLIRRGINAGTALDMGITNKAFDSYEQGLIRDVIAARIPAKLDRSRLFTD